MAEINITIRDFDNGKYGFKTNPDINEIAKKYKNGHPITNAESKALVVWAAIMKIVSEEALDEKQNQSPLIL